MRRTFALLLLLFLLSYLVLPVYADNSESVVFLTETGVCYHRDGCGSLWKSKIQTTLRYAVEHGYLFCERCRPPIPDFEYTATEQKEKLPSGPSGGRGDGDREQAPITTPTPSPSPKPKTEEKKEGKGDRVAGIVFAVLFLGLPVALAVGGTVCGIVYACKSKAEEKRRRTEEAARQQEEKQQMQELFTGKTKQEIARMCGMPQGVEIGDDGLPHLFDRRGHDEFVFYISASGEAFHKTPRCSKGARRSIHAVNLRRKRPCRRCKPVLPELGWYREYCRVVRLMQKYKIPPFED